MKRKNDWQRLLFGEIERHRTQAFAYGVSDCWTLANECHRAMTGKPLIAGIRYRTAVGARRVLKGLGLDSVADLVAAAGLPDVAPILAQRGDIGVVETAEGPSVAVCVGALWAHKSEAGLTHLPRSRVLKAYRVQ